MVRRLIILAPMQTKRGLYFALFILLAAACTACAGKKQAAKQPKPSEELVKLLPALNQLFEPKAALPLLYFSPDSLFLYPGLRAAGYSIYLLGTEEKIADFTTDPRFEGDVMGALMLAPTGLKAEGVVVGSVLLDRPLAAMEPAYLQTIMQQNMQILQPGGKLVVIQHKQAGRVADKQINQLQDVASFSKAYTDTSRSKLYDLLIIEK